MDEHAQQLVRLAELMNVSAGVLRDLIRQRDFGREASKLNFIAYDLERLSLETKRIGFSIAPE